MTPRTLVQRRGIWTSFSCPNTPRLGLDRSSGPDRMTLAHIASHDVLNCGCGWEVGVLERTGTHGARSPKR